MEFLEGILSNLVSDFLSFLFGAVFSFAYLKKTYS